MELLTAKISKLPSLLSYTHKIPPFYHLEILCNANQSLLEVQAILNAIILFMTVNTSEDNSVPSLSII